MRGGLDGLVGLVLHHLAQHTRCEPCKAHAPHIRGLVLRTGLGATAVGLALGLGAVALSARWLEPLLFETRAVDPVVVASVTGVLLVAGAAACVLPAGRAAGVEPSTCLNEE